MQKFRDMMEARGDTVVFTFGRLNPPTIGHGKVFDAIAKQQSKNTGSKMHIFVSHSQDAKKNPLSYNKKVAYIRKMFPKYAKNVVTSKARTIFEVAVELHDKGYKSIIMVVGSDRVAEFEKLLNEYNGVEGRHGYYGFDNIEVVSAGERDPDAEGAAGMSASKMRAAAVDGDFESFEKGLPPKFKDGKKLYQDVRKEMGIRENRDMGKMDVYEEMRDAYLTGKIWNVGDMIEANGNTGEIVRKGTNYVSYVTEDGKVHKAWLHDIQEKAERDYKKEYENYHSDPKQIKRRSSRNKARRAMGDKAVKGMDVGHKDNNPLNNNPKNLRNENPSTNRREPRLREDTAVKTVKDRIRNRKEIERQETERQRQEDDRALDAARLRDARDRNAKKEEAIIFEMSYLMKLKAKVDQMTHPKGYEKMMKAYVKRIKGSAKRDTQGGTIKVNNPSSIASDIAREYSVSPRNFIDYINKLVGKGILPKELKAEYQMESFKDFVAQLSIHEKVRRVKQDPDIKDDPGTEPAKYYKGVAKSVKPKRDDHFERGAKMDDDNPAAYTPAPGDKGGKTKPSKHTKKFKQMYGEEPEHEIKVGNYTTKFFHMCGSAQKVMKKNANVDGAEELTRMQDRFYGFEKKIVNAGSATDDQKKKAREMYNKIMQKAKDIGLDKKISGYMKMHIDSIEKGDPKLGFGRTDLSEKLDKNSSMSDYIKDFKKSDAPQFKGKSDRKRHTMAVAAYLSRNESLLDNVNRMLKEDGHTDVASMKNKVNIAMKALQKMQSELSKLGDEDDLPTWWTNKVATAVSRIDDMSDYLDSKVDESLWANIHKKRQRIKGGSGERMRKKGEKGAPTPAQMRRAKGEEAELNEWGEIEEAAEYQGRKVTLNKPFYTPDGPKKSAVYVKNEKGNVVKVTFGDPNMEIKRDDPARRKSFRARHNCDNPGPKTKARYWSCKAW